MPVRVCDLILFNESTGTCANDDLWRCGMVVYYVPCYRGGYKGMEILLQVSQARANEGETTFSRIPENPEERRIFNVSSSSATIFHKLVDAKKGDCRTYPCSKDDAKV
jgi:hypothetical protein